MEVNLIYITAGSTEEARIIGEKLIRSGLAACVNIIENMNALYLWKGEIQDDREVVLIAKTLKDRVPDLIEAVKSIHSYDCPCIVSLPVLDGNRAFLRWIADTVK